MLVAKCAPAVCISLTNPEPQGDADQGPQVLLQQVQHQLLLPVHYGGHVVIMFLFFPPQTQLTS